MRLARARVICSTLPHWSCRTVPNPQRPPNAAPVWKHLTGRQSPQKARLIKQATSPAMSEQQYQVLQPVKVTADSLRTYTGDIILKDCFKVASVTEKDADGVVLGLKSDEGSAALQDFNLGEVMIYGSACPVYLLPIFIQLWPGLQLHCSSFVSSARNKLWWMTPHWGSQAQDILPGIWHSWQNFCLYVCVSIICCAGLNCL